MPELFEFEWGVDQHGYVLEDGPPRPPRRGSLLSLFEDDEDDPAPERDGWNKTIRRRGGPLRYYRPMERSGLWRRFAEVASSQDGALEFVSEFGLLADLKKDSETTGFILNGANLLRTIAGALDNDDPYGAAILFNEYARPQVRATIRAPDPGEPQHPNFSLVPMSLRSALLLQAGNAITGNLKFRRCLNCPEWFQVGSGANTERRKFCTDRCRAAWSRRPAEERLAAGGGD